ncbi:MAG TPA: NRDE family protein [Burkholderiales bacterium]|jgi:uncharacterized protein with NRDE domain|nr:NRDE family protein [Burkholderiales bacterium]
MCLIACAWKAHPRYRLVVAANRDEHHSRPTAPAVFWEDASQLFAGRDLKDRGTWMGVTTQGRFAALTNYRDPTEFKAGAPTRGALVSNFLRESTRPIDYAESLGAIQYMYNGFNLLVGDADALWYVGNRAGAPREVPPGVHGLSNALLDTPWPKAVGLEGALAAALESAPDATALTDTLFAALAERSPAADTQLPDTGIGLTRERELSPRMIVAPLYGTRSATVLLIDQAGNIEFAERSFAPDGSVTGEVRRAIPAASS